MLAPQIDVANVGASPDLASGAMGVLCKDQGADREKV